MRGLTSKIISKVLTYNLLTPKDFPIDARNIMHNNSIRKGVRNMEATIDTTESNKAMVSLETTTIFGFDFSHRTPSHYSKRQKNCALYNPDTYKYDR